jgi:hypothetical protein
MKRFIFALLLTPMIMMAQPERERPDRTQMRERIKSERIAFITEQVKLSPEEAQSFWPVYNNFTSELEQIRKDLRKLRKNRSAQLDKLSDKELDEAFAEELRLMDRQNTLMKENHQQIRKILPARKVAQLYDAEQKFRIQLMKRMRERGMQQMEEE